MRLLRPLIASSSANTRSALSDAMKFTVFMRSSRSAACKKARVNSAPLAPVAATVSTWAVGCNGFGIYRCKFLSTRLTGTENREVSASKSSRGSFMDSPFSTRARRRTAAQQLALLQVKREINAADPCVRLKYVREFSEAFRDYRCALTDTELTRQYSTADVLLLGDYHALAASQDFAAGLITQLAQEGRPVVLAMEMAFSRDQYVLDEWQRGEISDDELRSGIHYDDEWGYDWEPFAHLLRQARTHACPIYGIDLKPRGNMRKIAARDRHAA